MSGAGTLGGFVSADIAREARFCWVGKTSVGQSLLRRCLDP